MYQFKNFTDLEEFELNLIYKWRNHEEIRRWSYSKEKNSFEDHLKFVKSLNNDESRKYWLVKRNGRPIGVDSVINIHEKTGELGFYIAPEFYPKFFAVEFLFFILKYLFEELNMLELYGYVELENNPANSLNDFFGFSKIIKTKHTNEGSSDYYLRKITHRYWKEVVSKKKEIILLVEKSKNH